MREERVSVAFRFVSVGRAERVRCGALFCHLLFGDVIATVGPLVMHHGVVCGVVCRVGGVVWRRTATRAHPVALEAYFLRQTAQGLTHSSGNDHCCRVCCGFAIDSVSCGR